MPELAQIKKPADPRLAIILTAVFLLASTYAVSNHEMWRDEIQAWLIARDSSSLFDLFHNLRYEGHPGLWHVFLMPLTRLTASPFPMQILHIFFASATIYLFAAYSPFTRIQKILFTFGYFPLFEYAVISRNYGISLLLITIFCLLFPIRHRVFPLVGLVFLLLANTNAFALVIVIVTGFSLFLDYLFLRKRSFASSKFNEVGIWIGFGLMLIGIASSIVQVVPPHDSALAVDWTYNFSSGRRMLTALKAIDDAFLPIPKIGIDYWFSRWIKGQALAVQILMLFLAALPLVCFVFVLIRKPTALLIFIAGTLALLVFYWIVKLPRIRHSGFLFILFIMTAWIYRFCDEIEWFAPINRYSEKLDRPFSHLLTFLLFLHLIGGVIAVHLDEKYVFSYAKRVAEYIEQEGLANLAIVGDVDFAASAVIGYLEKDQAYYPRGARFGSFVVWDKSGAENVPDQEVVEQAEALGDRLGEDVLVLTNRPLEQAVVESYPLVKLTHFSGSTVPDESFFLYLLEVRKRPDGKRE